MSGPQKQVSPVHVKTIEFETADWEAPEHFWRRVVEFAIHEGAMNAASRERFALDLMDSCLNIVGSDYARWRLIAYFQHKVQVGHGRDTIRTPQTRPTEADISPYVPKNNHEHEVEQEGEPVV